METENISITNDSGDHKYFTLIPNFILNHSTAIAQALYLQLKRLAGDNGTAYPGNQYLMDKLGISRNTLKKEFGYLLEKRWIKFVGEKEIQTDGGKQKVKAYKIVDLWQLNNEFYQTKGGSKKDIPLQRGVKIDDKEEPLKQEPLLEEEDATAVATPQTIAKDFFKGVSDLIEGKSSPALQEQLNKIADDRLVPKEILWAEIKKFHYFWTELNGTGKKQRWQMEKTFEVNRRLITWFSRCKDFKNKKDRPNCVSV